MHDVIATKNIAETIRYVIVCDKKNKYLVRKYLHTLAFSLSEVSI